MNIEEIGETPRNPMTNLENSIKTTLNSWRIASPEKSQGKSIYFGGNREHRTSIRLRIASPKSMHTNTFKLTQTINHEANT